MSGKDWQTAIDRGTVDFPYGSAGRRHGCQIQREGARRRGVAAVRPDLSNAAEYAAGRLEYEDAVSGGTHRAPGRVVALALYNPQEPIKALDVCPPCPACLRTPGGGECPFPGCLSGWSRTQELVPSGRGEQLLNYLASLKEVEPLQSDQINAPGLSHSSDYAAILPRWTWNAKKAVQPPSWKRQGVYLSKCAICPGRRKRHGDKGDLSALAAE